MKRGEIKQLRGKSLEELRKMLMETKEELGKLRMEKSSQKLKKIHALKIKRKDIARMLTIIREKEFIHE